MITRSALIATLAATLIAFTAPAADPADKTGKLVAVLRSNTSLFEKARACQQLGEVGSRDAVPALVALLSDPQLAAYARSGLEGIADPSAAAALREEAGRLKGPLLAGVVNSLGTIRDPEAVELLGKLAADPGSSVAKEALLALGNISSPASFRILKRALAKGPEAIRTEAAAACLLAADIQRTSGNLRQAREWYDLVRGATMPMTYRVGATRGAILSRGSGRVSFLMDQLRSEEPAIRNAALLAIREIPDDALATALNKELKRARPDLQAQILLALVDCHNAQSISAVEAQASGSNPEVRKTALTVLGRMGPSAAPALLSMLPKDQPKEEKSIIMAGLRSLEGPAVDDQLLVALGAATKPDTRIDLIRLLESRGAAKASNELLKQAAGAEPEVSIAALSALKSLAGSADLPALVKLTKACQNEAVKEAAESAVVGVCSRSGKESTEAEMVLRELTQARTAAEKNCWIRVLTGIGCPKALPAIEAAASDPDETIADNALAQLGRWPDPAPMETLLKAMETGTKPALKKRALASAIELSATVVDEGQRPAETVTPWLQRELSAAQSTADKRRILGILGRVKTAESLRLLTPFLDDPNLRTEAASAVVQIAPALAKGTNSAAVKAALDKIAATVDNADLRDRARQASKSIAGQ